MLNIFNIQRFSIHDGDGIRTNIFFKGCPLKCPWCSNPESRSSKPNLMYDRKMCLHFYECIAKSNGALSFVEDRLKLKKDAKLNIEQIREACPAKALRVAGEDTTVDELLSIVKRDLPFYEESNGGVTLTGGEPFSQELDLLELVRELKAQSIHVAVETSLHVQWSKIEPFVPFIDCWLTDIKHVDDAKYKKFTGGNLQLVQHNFHRLDALGANMIARVPVIPGFNDTEEELHAIIDFITTLNAVDEVHFMPYHNFGEGKYELLDMPYQYEDTKKPEASDLLEITQYAKSKNLKYKIGG